MLGYLSLDIICSEKRTVFRERSSRKTVSFGIRQLKQIFLYAFHDEPQDSVPHPPMQQGLCLLILVRAPLSNFPFGT